MTEAESMAYEALRTAQLHEHLGVQASSAKLCAEEAEDRFNEERFDACIKWALESLKHSVGVFHTACIKVQDIWDRY